MEKNKHVIKSHEMGYVTLTCPAANGDVVKGTYTSIGIICKHCGKHIKN